MTRHSPSVLSTFIALRLRVFRTPIHATRVFRQESSLDDETLGDPGRADLPHPALRRASQTRPRPRPTAHPSPAHTAPAAAAEPCLALLDRRVNPRALGRFESTPEVRPLPAAGITRLPRYYEPVRHPSAARPVPRGRPVGRSSPASAGASRVASFTLKGSRPAQRSLALRPAGSRDRLAVLGIEGFGDLVTSSAAPLVAGWSESCRAGITPAEQRRLVTAHRRHHFLPGRRRGVRFRRCMASLSREGMLPPPPLFGALLVRGASFGMSLFACAFLRAPFLRAQITKRP
jgi:hypothetical protein